LIRQCPVSRTDGKNWNSKPKLFLPIFPISYLPYSLI